VNTLDHAPLIVIRVLKFVDNDHREFIRDERPERSATLKQIGGGAANR
jgi:hypothetical protein